MSNPNLQTGSPVLAVIANGGGRLITRRATALNIVNQGNQTIEATVFTHVNDGLPANSVVALALVYDATGASLNSWHWPVTADGSWPADADLP